MEADTSEVVREDKSDVHPVTSSSNHRNLNDYIGYEPPNGVSMTVDRVSSDIAPQDFYEKYVRARKPAIIEQHIKDSTWKGSLWNNKYLTEKAGKADVLVEKRVDDKNSMFGLSAPKVNMKYGEFLEQIEKKSEQYYLTTQDLERFQDDLDDFDMPKSILAEPLKSLKDDFPACPSLLGKLIPYQVSLWQGNSRNGSSSGLHHDFHDNLYILMRGRKRFRLFPPSAAPHMLTMGRPIKIHANGLIVYQSQSVNPTVNIRADGVPLAFLARRKRIEAEQELAIAEEELYSIQDSAGIPEAVKDAEIKRLQGVILDCEDRIDLAMEEMLQYGNTFDYDYTSDDVISVHGDDSEIDDDDDEDDDSKDKTVKKCQGNDDKAESQPPAKVMRLANGSRAIINTSKDSDLDNGADKIVQIPDHFCNVVLPTDTDDPELILSKFPNKECISCLTVVVKPGEMLYLPASWFHEVTSYNDESCGVESEGADWQGHLALNYWMFPPDGDTFDLPYRDDFWPKRWEAIVEERDSIFSLANRSKLSRTTESADVINLDSDEDIDDYEEDDVVGGEDSVNPIVVGDDSLLDTSGDTENPIVIESQTSKTQDFRKSVDIDISSGADISGNGETVCEGGESLEDSISDKILDSSEDEETKAVGDKECNKAKPLTFFQASQLLPSSGDTAPDQHLETSTDPDTAALDPTDICVERNDSSGVSSKDNEETVGSVATGQNTNASEISTNT